jgi:DNA-binding transcriptional LysR family regulator
MVNVDKLNWDDLRYFLRAVQSKTLAGAARTMDVEHSTVGRRLTALERALGAPLVIRGPEGLQLTALGESAAPLAEQIERAVTAVRALATQQKVRVRLATPSGFIKLFSANLPQLRVQHPQLALEIMSGAAQVNLKKGEVDLAIRAGPVMDEDLIARKLGVSGASLYASAAYLARRSIPVDLDDLSGHDLIGFDDSLAGMPAAQWIEQRAGKATLVLRSREMTDMLAAALSGIGLALLPCILGDAEQGLTRLTPKVLAYRELSLVYRREARQAEPVRAVIRFVMDVMRQNADQIAGTLSDD